MRISHEAIYQALSVQGRGALRRELTACLRTGRALRVPRARSRGRGKHFVTLDLLISQRPSTATDRAVPGHWEGDLILGLGSSAIGTLVERTTRFTLLLHLPRMAGHAHSVRVKNGPALAGHGAGAVRDAIARSIATLPAQLRRSLTWDQGGEMAWVDVLDASGLRHELMANRFGDELDLKIVRVPIDRDEILDGDPSRTRHVGDDQIFREDRTSMTECRPYQVVAPGIRQSQSPPSSSAPSTRR
jgi:hypothetical protein